MENKLRSVYIDDARWNKLRELAKADGRSVNNYLTEVIINNHIDTENEKNTEIGKEEKGSES